MVAPKSTQSPREWFQICSSTRMGSCKAWPLSLYLLPSLHTHVLMLIPPSHTPCNIPASSPLFSLYIFMPPKSIIRDPVFIPFHPISISPPPTCHHPHTPTTSFLYPSCPYPLSIPFITHSSPISHARKNPMHIHLRLPIILTSTSIRSQPVYTFSL